MYLIVYIEPLICMKSGVEVEILSSQYWNISEGKGYTDLETEEGIVTSCKGETYIVTVTDPTVTEYIVN